MWVYYIITIDNHFSNQTEKNRTTRLLLWAVTAALYDIYVQPKKYWNRAREWRYSRLLNNDERHAAAATHN
jgi:hypothetical protein